MWTKEVCDMKKKLKVKFMNEFDVNVFDEYFYKHMLNNVVSLLQKKKEKLQIECRTCACLEQVNQ